MEQAGAAGSELTPGSGLLWSAPLPDYLAQAALFTEVTPFAQAAPRGHMANKFSQFLADNKIDPRRVVAVSKHIEGLRPEDRRARFLRSKSKAAGDKPAAAEAEAKPAKPRSGRPVNVVLLRRLEAGKKVSGPAKQRLVRALNHILTQKKK